MKYWEIKSGGVQTTYTYYVKRKHNPLEDRLDNGEPNPDYLGDALLSDLEEDWYCDCGHTLEDFDGDEHLLEETCRREVIDTNYGIRCKEIYKEDVPEEGLDFE